MTGEQDPGQEMWLLWQRFRPQTHRDWRRVAQLVIAAGGMQHPSPLFAALLEAEQELINRHEATSGS